MYRADSEQLWMQLLASLNVESTHWAIGIILGKNKEAERQVSTSIPLGFKGSGSFLVDTLHLKNAEDIKWDENGSWVNWGSGVSKLWLQSDL